MKYQEFFKGKKITLLGLGLLGRGVGDAKFLAKYAKELVVTDLKTEAELKASLKKLSKFKNIKFVLGHHNLSDFIKTDMVIKGAGVSLNSPFIEEALRNDVPVHMSTAIFAKFFINQFGGKIVGITGTRGKTTVTHLIYHMLKEAGRNAIIGGNIQGVSTLAMLEKISPQSIAVLELDSWQLQGFEYEKISPQISIFTTFFPDHMNYYKDNMKKYFLDKAQIFLWQSKTDYLILGEQTAPKIKQFRKRIKSKIIIARKKDCQNLKTVLMGEHNKSNIACAIKAAVALKIPPLKIYKAIKNFTGVKGRLEHIKTINRVRIYNDTTSTTPEATIAGLKALDLDLNKRIVLICGGADKGLDMNNFIREANLRAKKIILISGTGTERIKNKFKKSPIYNSLKKAVADAVSSTNKGDAILFSPAFASFGMFKNEYDRGDKFNGIIKNLKIKNEYIK